MGFFMGYSYLMNNQESAAWLRLNMVINHWIFTEKKLVYEGQLAFTSKNITDVYQEKDRC